MSTKGRPPPKNGIRRLTKLVVRATLPRGRRVTCRQTHLPRTTLSHAQSLHRLVLLVVRVYSHTLTSMHLHGSRLKRIFVYHLKTLHPQRAMSYTLQNLTPRTSTLSTPFPEPVFQHSEQPAKINGHSSVAPGRKHHLLQVMSPTGLFKTGITGTSPETVRQSQTSWCQRSTTSTHTSCVTARFWSAMCR